MINHKYNPKLLIEKVNLWQQSPFVRPLICKECQTKLMPQQESAFKVILKCHNCNWVQPYIPKSVIKYDLIIPAILKKNLNKYNPFS